MRAVWGAAGTFARLTAECKGACSLGCCLGWQAHSFEIDCQQLFGACAIVGVFFRYLRSMLMQLLKETKGNPPYGFWACFKGNHEQCPRFFVRSLILDATDVARSGPIETAKRKGGLLWLPFAARMPSQRTPRICRAFHSPRVPSGWFGE